MNFSIYQNVKSDGQFSACIGLDKQGFLSLTETFKNIYEPKKTNRVNGIVPYLTDPAEALFFVLYYLKANPTFMVLGVAFGMSNRAAHAYVDYILPYLKAALGREGMLAHRFFGSQESFDKAFEGVTDIFIDGTEIPVQRSVDHELQKADYSGKKNAIR